MPTPTPDRPRIAVISPFIDKRHGTERCIAEQIERLAKNYEIHLYSSRVEDLDLSRITWHRIWIPPGPHLFSYIWWLFANRFHRWWRRLRPDLIYSPGINCLDADLIGVHMLFESFRLQMRSELSLRKNPVLSWPVLIHRRIYYKFLGLLESRVYSDENVELVTVSEKTARETKELYGRREDLTVIYHGLDTARFAPARRLVLRPASRAALKLADDEFAILLIGNDLKKKGFTCLLEAVGKIANPKIRLLIVGDDSPVSYQELIRMLRLTEQVKLLPMRHDVEFYYAAADVYAGPSIEDTYSMPPAEAMACGLPAITSRAAGVSEIVHHGVDGMILEDPKDSKTLSGWLARFMNDPNFRAQMGKAAAVTAAQYTWDENARQLQRVIEKLVSGKKTLHKAGGMTTTASR
ncbi:MAG: glycosyltransferase family 4 protein [Candidatus Acidiferrales bacterium]